MIITEKDKGVTNCLRCGKEILYTQLYCFDGGNGYCLECYVGAGGGRLIIDHSYKPTPIFCHMSTEKETKREKLLYLGIELEVENRAVNLGDYAYDIQKNNGIYIKHDGSLERGFEIVSHPQTAKYHQKVFNWYNLLEQLRKDRFTSYDNGRCGLHIHVNKNFFNNKDDMLKIVLFFYKCFNRLKRFSKRRDMNYCKKWKQPLVEQVEAEKGSVCLSRNNDDRYSCINFQNHDTVEFRIYKGTLNYDRFLASILFTDAVCNFIKDYSLVFFTNKKHKVSYLWNEFLRYIKVSDRYHFLERYFVKHNLDNNQTALTSELPSKEDYLTDKKRYKVTLAIFDFKELCKKVGIEEKYIPNGLIFEGEKQEFEYTNFNLPANLYLKQNYSSDGTKTDFVLPRCATRMILHKDNMIPKVMAKVLVYMARKSDYYMNVVDEDGYKEKMETPSRLIDFIGGSGDDVVSMINKFIHETTFGYEIIRGDFEDVYNSM